MINRALQRLQGLVWGDGAKDTSVYIEDNAVTVDALGRDAGKAAFRVRGLSASGAPTTLFQVDKDGYQQGGVYYAKAYGAKGDGTGDDGPAINAAIAAAQAAGNATVVLGPGLFRVTTQIVIAGLRTGIAFVGLPSPTTLQQGSIAPPSAINWAGGATSAISVGVTYTQFANVAIYNTGTGTAALEFAPNGRADVSHVSFAGPNGSTPWSTAAILSTAGLNYSRIDFCDFAVSPALKMTGVHTTLEITGCLFDGAGADPMIDLNGVTGDLVSIHNCTFNAESTAKTFVDCSSSTGQLGNLVMRDCEFDCASGSFQSSIAKLKNVYQFTLQNCEISNYSNAANTASLVQLTAVSMTRIMGCNLSHLNKPLVKVNDTVSKVSHGPNTIDVATTAGIVDATGATSTNVVLLDSSTSPVANHVRLHGELLDPTAVGTFVVTVPNNTNFTIEFPGPSDGTDPGWMAVGQVFVVRIRAAATIGTITWDARLHLAGAFTNPASGNNRSILFCMHTTGVAFEVSRTAADVAN